jgi:uncharacterized membrane protein YdbT with pleckstrin-like domain
MFGNPQKYEQTTQKAREKTREKAREKTQEKTRANHKKTREEAEANHKKKTRERAKGVHPEKKKIWIPSMQTEICYTHLLRTIFANSDVECILRAKTLHKT